MTTTTKSSENKLQLKLVLDVMKKNPKAPNLKGKWKVAQAPLQFKNLIWT